jgi:hypothetical protein
MALQVQWGKCANDQWCALNLVDLSHPAFEQGGVYVIWHGGSAPRVVRIGQAMTFRERLLEHRTDPAVQAYASNVLFVTWANLNKAYRDGVEVWLAGQYNPLVGSRFPDVEPIAVNGPWG